MTVLFDGGPLGNGSFFQAPEQVIEAWQPEEVGPALRAMEDAQASGKWLAGSVSYELGYVFIPKIAARLPANRKEPLLQCAVFDKVMAPPDRGGRSTAELTRFEPEWDFDRYGAAFDRVHRYLRNGDIYQANLTFPMVAQFRGDLYGLYDALRRRQPVPHGAFVDLGETKLLSRSPELFFSLSADGQLRARPMKGTIGRSAVDTEDAALKAQLAQSEKDRAENLMITDLLRNDLGRLSQIGSIRVPTLFGVETYATVHQMISEVTGQIRPDCTLTDVFAALFPCGSITGAPKIRAMEILSELEDAPRGSYCGAIGWIGPDGAMEFNVAIRTLICEPSGRVTLNVGGGIVYDSNAEGEYGEALLKARFAQSLAC